MLVAIVLSVIFLPLCYVYFYEPDRKTGRLTVSIPNLIGTALVLIAILAFIFDPYAINAHNLKP